jgi:hypothetical protein
MRRPSVVLGSLGIAALATAAMLSAGPAQAAPGATMKVMASHLSNPRDLTVTPTGVVYVAESGRANDKNCAGGNCAGLTSQVTRIGADGAHPFATGLISAGGPGGVATGGVSSISFDRGNLYAIFGGNTSEIPPLGTPGFPPFLLKAAHNEIGQLALVTGGPQGVKPLVPVGDQDFAWTATHKFLVPDQFPDANPNDVLAYNGQIYVADAGANVLSRIGKDGKAHQIVFFPAPKGSPTDTVPTCVTPGPGGALYVGELLGGNFAPGHARVWKVWFANGSWHRQVWRTGFTTIQGCAFDRWGNFYATEFQVNGLNEDPSGNPAGALVKVAPNGQRTMLGVGSLFYSSGTAVGRDGSVYVSNCSIAPAAGFGPCPKGGQVVRFSF